ncbi:carboxymuconolactone decarboxylase family protein [Undibacterium sp. TJN25]|uniref:carboxymuconolactone decarboxylase family protein n=1 Tax=Undibacterium sp. TJN25 TaxID=3413056 RepID=UPI003BF061D3
MTRLYNPAISEATGQAAQLFAAIKSAAGMVPNAYATLGSNSPVALEAVLTLDGAVKKSSLSTKEIEVIKVSVSEAVDCDYCVAAHTAMSKKAGLSREAILALRHGQPSGDVHNDALASFARYLITTRGTVPAEVLGAVKAAGFTDAQLADISMVIAAITFTNIFNRVNDTVIDFPAAD